MQPCQATLTPYPFSASQLVAVFPPELGQLNGDVPLRSRVLNGHSGSIQRRFPRQQIARRLETSAPHFLVHHLANIPDRYNIAEPLKSSIDFLIQATRGKEDVPPFPPRPNQMASGSFKILREIQGNDL